MLNLLTLPCYITGVTLAYYVSGVESRNLHSQGVNSKEGKFHLVRIGQPEKIHPELVKLGLDEQAEKLLAEGKFWYQC